MKANRKTFGRTKPRKVSAIKKTKRAIHKREISSVVKHFIDIGKPDKVEQFLLDRGVAPCVAREWGNEPARRKHMTDRNQEIKLRKEISLVGKRGDFGRRIVSTAHRFGREIVFHATKGVRTYRIAAEVVE